ncbi:MAG: S26 family signal peptidase [Bacteroidota bacterium]|nr:S26 family signal peptidase [Bacteroidota bacterium]
MKGLKTYLLSAGIAVILMIIINHFFLSIYSNNSKGKIRKYLVLKVGEYRRQAQYLYRSENNHYKSRLIGLPGDTIRISHSLATVNGTPIDLKKNVLKKYRMINFFNNSLDLVKDTVLNVSLAELIAQHPKINIREASLEEEINKKNYFPYSFRYRWNAGFVGPLVVPGKGNPQNLTSKTERLYKGISKKKGQKLTFNSNYYYFLNDNRSNTSDSRTIGFVNEKNIIGKVIYSW